VTAPVSRAELVRQLQALGVKAGGVLLVHTAFSKVRPVEDGPEGLIAALQAAVGPEGTLAMPSMGEDDDHPFDRDRTSCLGLGVVAETFRRLPGVLRSDNPHAFAARGPAAAEITRPHPPDVPHGPGTPVARIHDLDGQVLLLGVGHDSDTTIHLAEYLAGVRYRAPKHVTLLRDGRPTRLDYDEIDHCCQNFARVDGWLEADAAGDPDRRQRRGPVGHAEARLVRARAIVDAVVPRLRADETAFLHPFGVDDECDLARRSIPAHPR
jgi:aminoglycoside 3-N-acetyltransferase